MLKTSLDKMNIGRAVRLYAPARQAIFTNEKNIFIGNSSTESFQFKTLPKTNFKNIRRLFNI